MKKALVLGAGGFIGNHLVTRLKNEGYWVRGVDLKSLNIKISQMQMILLVGDLKDVKLVSRVFWHEDKRTMEDVGFDEVYQLAADMGGAGYIFSGENDANVMHNSAVVNLNVAMKLLKLMSVKYFIHHQLVCTLNIINLDPDNPNCEESSAYPANPDSEYGWEKLFSERLYLAYNRNYGS
jgi:GDP-D-mannose 3',5'-epimerase